MNVSKFLSSLVRVIEQLQSEIRVGVMECDIDAQITKQGLDALGVDDVDVIFIENVGNLVCPAEFDTGADFNITILSVPEGDDKPLKYPLMFTVSDLVLISKIDTIDYFDFDFEAAKERIHHLNPKADIIQISAKTGEGMDELVAWIEKEITKVK